MTRTLLVSMSVAALLVSVVPIEAAITVQKKTASRGVSTVQTPKEFAKDVFDNGGDLETLMNDPRYSEYTPNAVAEAKKEMKRLLETRQSAEQKQADGW